jgi:hypothetical protein
MHWMDIVVFGPLVERLEEIDRQLDALHEALVSNDGDPLSVLDDMEELVGEGFLRCQLYMIERKGERPPRSAYECGPRHKSNYFADVINTAGNYRKHRGEWPADRSKSQRGQHRTASIFRDAGVIEDEFWLLNLLFHLTSPGLPRFASLIRTLIEWREALDLLPSPSTSTTQTS